MATLLAFFADAAYYPPAAALRETAAGAVRCCGSGGIEAVFAPALARRCFAGRLRVRLLHAQAVPRHARLALECGDAEAACAVRDFLDRSYALELPLRRGVDTLRLRLRAGACVPPFACGGGRDAASLGVAEVRIAVAQLRGGAACTATARLQGPGGGGELRIALHLLPLARARKAEAMAPPEPALFSTPLIERSSWRYEQLVFVTHRGTDTQAAVWRSRRGCTVAVAFRGTEPGSARDVATDVRFTNAHVPATHFAFADGAAEPLSQARVHAGFAAAYASVRRHVRAAVEAALQGREAGPATTLLITGHSLGGALATLCAADVAESWAAAGLPASRRPLLLLHTFGSPRVGDARFAARFAQLVPHALRIVAGKDLVPSLPPAALGFAHAGAGVHLPEAGLSDEHAAKELPGTDYEREPGEIAASAASGLGVKHHLLGHYQAALVREDAARARRRNAA